MASQGVKRKLTTILAADVVGYSRLMGADEVGTLAALKAHRRELIDSTIAAHGGRIVKTTGDGMLVEFPSVVEAVQCAVEMQRAMADRNAGIPADQRITFRIGINLGDVIVEGDDIFGDGVNVAARLEGLAEPGGIAIAATVREHIDGKVEAHFVDAGEHLVKNMARALRVWRWHGAGSPAGADDRLHGLSKRERQIAELYANGQNYKEIAEALFRAPSTIRNHLNAIYQKLNIGSKVELLQLVLAQRAGAMPPEDAASDVRIAADRPAATHPPDPTPPLPDAPSIIVLPFINASGDADQEYFCDGITEDLITELSRFRELLVVSRNSSFVFKNQVVSAAEVAERSGVQYVVEGSIRKSGERVRITAQLIDAHRDKHIWAERYDREIENIFEVQDDVVRRIASTLVGRLEHERQQRTLPIRLSPTPTICSVSPRTAGKGRRRRIEEAIRLILDCSENRTGV